VPSDDAIDIAWRLLKTQTNLNQFMPHGVYGDLPAPVFVHGARRGIGNNDYGQGKFRSRDYANIVREGLDPSSMLPYTPIGLHHPYRRRMPDIGIGSQNRDLHEWELDDDTGFAIPIASQIPYGIYGDNTDARHYFNPEFPDKIKQLMLDRHHPKNPQNYGLRRQYWRPEWIYPDRIGDDFGEGTWTAEPQKISDYVTSPNPYYWRRNSWLDFQNPERHKRTYSGRNRKWATESDPEGRKQEWNESWLHPDFDLEKPEFGWTQEEDERYGGNRRANTLIREKGTPRFSQEQAMRLFPETYAHPKWRGIFPTDFDTHGVDKEGEGYNQRTELTSPSFLSAAGENPYARRHPEHGPIRPQDDYNRRQALAASKLNQAKWHAEHGPKGATFVTRPEGINQAMGFGEPIGIRPIQGPKSDRGFVMHQPSSFAFDNAIPGEGVLFDKVPPEQLVFGRKLSPADEARAIQAGMYANAVKHPTHGYITSNEPFDPFYAMGLKPIPEKYADWEPEEEDDDEDDFWKSEPMDLAMRLLKRQTELGEFHEDFPSSHGPVTEYHGTIDLPSVLEQGLKGKVMARHRAVRPPAEMEGQPVVYTTDDPDAAKQWAESRGRNLKVPSGKVGVIGVRGSNLPSVEQSDPHSQFRGTTRVRTPNIPRENITPFE